MKLFIWEGNGISQAYHDDGTLIVLVNTPEEARKIVRDAKRQGKLASEAVAEAARKLGDREPYYWRQADEEAFVAAHEEMQKKYPQVLGSDWDGSDGALDRKPDQIIELDKPKFVAFNGGGYD